jgi:hypothetical protein
MHSRPGQVEPTTGSGSHPAESGDGRTVTLLPTPARIDLKTIDDDRVAFSTGS